MSHLLKWSAGMLAGVLLLNVGILNAQQRTSMVIPLGFSDSIISLEKCVYLAKKFSSELQQAYPNIAIVQTSCRKYKSEMALVFEFKDAATSIPESHHGVVEIKDLAIANGTTSVPYTLLVPITESRTSKAHYLDRDGNVIPYFVQYSWTRQVPEMRTRDIVIWSIDDFDEDILRFLTLNHVAVDQKPAVAYMSFAVSVSDMYKLVIVKTLDVTGSQSSAAGCTDLFADPET